jgi:hypothetical protein
MLSEKIVNPKVTKAGPRPCGLQEISEKVVQKIKVKNQPSFS